MLTYNRGTWAEDADIDDDEVYTPIRRGEAVTVFTINSKLFRMEMYYVAPLQKICKGFLYAAIVTDDNFDDTILIKDYPSVLMLVKEHEVLFNLLRNNTEE